MIKWRAAFFSEGDNGEIANIHWKQNSSSSKALRKVQTKLEQSILAWKGLFVQIVGQTLFQKKIIVIYIKKITLTTCKIYLNIFRTTWPIESKLGTIQHWWRGFVCSDVGHAFLQKWMIAKSRNVDVIQKIFFRTHGPILNKLLDH